MRYLSVQDYANEQGVTTQSVYARIKRGTLQTITKRVDNKDTTFVVADLNDNEDNTIVRSVGNVAEQKESSQLQENTINQHELMDTLQRIHEDYRALAMQNIELAQLAGQTKLLTDSEYKTKQHFFELTAENKTLIKERAELAARVELLQDKLKDYEEKRYNLTDWLRKL